MGDHLVLSEQLHIHVALHGPLGACDVLQPGRGRVEGRLAIGEGADHAGPPSDFAHYAFHGDVRLYPGPILVGEGVVDQGFVDSLLELLGDLPKLHGLELAGDLSGLGPGGPGGSPGHGSP